MDVCGWVAMTGFIMFQLLCWVAPDIEVGNIYVNGLIVITLTSGVVFAIGLAAIAAALVVCSIIAFCLQHLPQRAKSRAFFKARLFAYSQQRRSAATSISFMQSALVTVQFVNIWSQSFTQIRAFSKDKILQGLQIKLMIVMKVTRKTTLKF